MVIFITTFMNSCNKDILTPYTTSFIHIMLDELITTSISCEANAVKTYSVYFSSAPITETLNVTYEVIVGDGLKEGVDFEYVNKGNTLVFLPGIYDMPIRIKWLPNPIDISKDNTLKIKLISNNLNINMGLPGPDKKQTEFTITKVK